MGSGINNNSFLAGLLGGVGDHMLTQEERHYQEKQNELKLKRSVLASLQSDPNSTPQAQALALQGLLSSPDQPKAKGIRGTLGGKQAGAVSPLDDIINQIKGMPAQTQPAAPPIQIPSIPSAPPQATGGNQPWSEVPPIPVPGMAGSPPLVPPKLGMTGAPPQLPQETPGMPEVPGLKKADSTSDPILTRELTMLKAKGEAEAGQAHRISGELTKASPAERPILAASWGVKLPDMPIDTSVLQSSLKQSMADLPPTLQADLLGQVETQAKMGKAEEGVKSAFQQIAQFHSQQATDARSQKAQAAQDDRQSERLVFMAAQLDKRLAAQEKRQNQPKALTPKQRLDVQDLQAASERTMESIDTVLSHPEVLKDWKQAARAQMSGTALGRVFSATPDQLKVATAMRRLQEQVNLLRRTYAATGFRGGPAWEALQGMHGNFSQNPDQTLQLLSEAKEDLTRANEFSKEALGTGGQPASGTTGGSREIHFNELPK